MIRGITLRGAIALNVITMIGIGPLITIPLVLAQLAGPLALAGWLVGALVALCDGLVWSELGSRYPGSGGTYVYLREIFGAERWGRMFAFLYNWQFFLSASLIISTGFIGFANYAGYIFPPVASSPTLRTGVALAIGVLTIALLYRRITTAAKFGVVLAAVAIVTLLLVGTAGFTNADFHRAFTLAAPVSFGWGFLSALGGALFITLYDYSGYFQIALVGEECHEPGRTLPLSIIASIFIVLVLYVFLQVGVLGAIPWQTLVGHNGSPPPANAQFVGSIVVAKAWGARAAAVVTVLVLITAFASVYGGLLGNSRVPFAAARDGEFLPVFAKLHPTKQFPHVSLLAMGALSLIGCFFDLTLVIAILSTAAILIGSIGQIVALFVLRSRGELAPFRMWLYPLPAIVALAGWALAFVNTGTTAIIFGVAWLAIGIVVYLFTARAQRVWPFAAALALALITASSPLRATAGQVPFFVYGATFFYERIPRSQWADALAQYRAMGINTIDLYVMWNWHELRDGDFDFTGRTNPRRDLVGLFRLIRDDGFRVALRPGPVIRNEWRNGGYPAWLLQRPEYNMPLRDVLEGRYPATATLQNKHSDAAAQEWMNNPTHMRYATRWLDRVFRTVHPWQSQIVAVALDDDQGAYLDNDTWPGPHFHRYIGYLASVAHRDLGASMPVFINTLQMKVTASAPVWAWGNWYQSDAYTIGEHDRTQLEFSTGLLQTQIHHRPIMVSEFQAGWLQGADEAWPRPADPTNTTLAFHTMLQMGAHGIVNFPVQDTMNPAGWEAPWTNAFYSWDAALSVDLKPQARYASTAQFGHLIAQYGLQLSQTHPAADAAIVYMTSAYDASRITNDQIAQIAQATMDAQRGCRIVRITCGLVDARYATQADLDAYRTLIVPRAGISLQYISHLAAAFQAFRKAGGEIVTSARFANASHPSAGGIPNAVLLVSNDHRFAFLDIVNYARSPLHTRAARVGAPGFSWNVPALTVPARDALLLPLGVAAQDVTASPATVTAASAPGFPLRSGSWIEASLRTPPPGGVIAYKADVFQDGSPAVVLENSSVRLIISLCAGARAFVFENKAHYENLFTTIGGLRDAWSQQLPPSSRDYIAKYTHPIATGTFNRCYDSSTLKGDRRVSASFHIHVSDAPPHGATFYRTVMMNATDAGFTVFTSVQFAGANDQRAQQITSFAIDAQTQILRLRNGCAFFEPARRHVVLVAWPTSAAIPKLDRHPHDALLTITFAPGPRRAVFYGVRDVNSVAQAQAALAAFTNRR